MEVSHWCLHSSILLVGHTITILLLWLLEPDTMCEEASLEDEICTYIYSSLDVLFAECSGTRIRKPSSVHDRGRHRQLVPWFSCIFQAFMSCIRSEEDFYVFGFWRCLQRLLVFCCCLSCILLSTSSKCSCFLCALFWSSNSECVIRVCYVGIGSCRKMIVFGRK